MITWKHNKEKYLEASKYSLHGIEADAVTGVHCLIDKDIESISKMEKRKAVGPSGLDHDSRPDIRP